MKNGIFFILMLALFGYANAQVSHTASFSYSGDCSSSLGAKVWIRAAESLCNHHNSRTYSSCEERNEARTFLLSESGTQDGCTIRFSATPCTPCGGVNAFGNSIISEEPSVIGLSQGTSFFSSNPANEIQDWAEDNEDLLRILGGEEPHRSEIVMENGYVFSAHMPGTIREFVLDDNPEIYGASDGVHVPDDFFDRPFSLDTRRDYYSDDFRNIKTELHPVHFAEEAKKSFDLDDVFFDDLGDVLKFAVSLPLYAEAATLFLADMTLNLVVEDVKMGYKLYKGEYVNMDEVTSTIAYNTLNKTIEDALFIVTSKSFMKVFPLPQLPESVYSGSLSFLTTFVSINSRHINAGE